VLSYRHAYHAGNLADVFKHVSLCAVLDAVRAKDAPALYLDTHAGAGQYDLHDAAAQQNREYAAGIEPLWQLRDQAAPTPVTTYLMCIGASNPGGRLRAYPGACAIAAQLLPPPHRLLLCERHPQDVDKLAAHFARAAAVRVVCDDGYGLLKSELPPRERRAVILIDPGYEQRNELSHLTAGLVSALDRCRHGVYLIWYPLTGKLDVPRLHRTFVRLKPPKTLRLELSPGASTVPGAVGSGLLVVNPPYSAVATLTAALTYLAARLVPSGSHTCEWLVGE
jgi:23S rRNA (adenine2030-N6)-methyltransferase